MGSKQPVENTEKETELRLRKEAEDSFAVGGFTTIVTGITILSSPMGPLMKILVCLLGLGMFTFGMGCALILEDSLSDS